jgi:hypothetical protein
MSTASLVVTHLRAGDHSPQLGLAVGFLGLAVAVLALGSWRLNDQAGTGRSAPAGPSQGQQARGQCRR